MQEEARAALDDVANQTAGRRDRAKAANSLLQAKMANRVTIVPTEGLAEASGVALAALGWCVD